MASYSTIQFNYRKAISQANRLEDLADELRGIAKRNVENSLNNLARNWEGDSARQFINKGNKAQNDIIKTAKQLDDTAKAIKRAAENVRRAELEALRIAQEIARRKG